MKRVLAVSVLVVVMAAGAALPDAAAPPRRFTASEIIRGFKAATGKLLVRCSSRCYVVRKHVGDLLTVNGEIGQPFDITVYAPGWGPNLKGLAGRAIQPDTDGIYWMHIPHEWIVRKRFGVNVWLSWRTPYDAPRSLGDQWDLYASVLADVTTTP